eukprot:4437127-Pyramimonas_sp.AAC.1
MAWCMKCFNPERLSSSLVLGEIWTTYSNYFPVRGRSGPRLSSRSLCSIRYSSARIPPHGRRNVVALPLAPTLWRC